MSVTKPIVLDETVQALNRLISHQNAALDIIAGGDVIDLSLDTVTAADVLEGVTFHLPDGTESTGTCEYNCDTSSDTVTAADVASGKTFHLANGLQGTGTASSASATAEEPKSAIGVRDSNTQLHFTIENEPTWFFCYQWADRNSSSAVRDIMIVFDGTSLGVADVSSNSSTAYVYMSRVGNYESMFSFTYSSGTLTITAPQHTMDTIFGTGPWKLYYL